MPELELAQIHPSKLNPRLDFGDSGLTELTDSIKQVGLLEPIIVRQVKQDWFEIVVGERRFRAAQKAGLKKIPVVIRDYSDAEVVEVNLVENIQREDLSDVEKGNACVFIMVHLPIYSLLPGLRCQTTFPSVAWQLFRDTGYSAPIRGSSGPEIKLVQTW